MATASNVQIFNEAGTGVVATGTTADAHDAAAINVANVQVQVGQHLAVHSEYQVQVGAHARRGMMCTALDVNASTATFQ